MKKSIFVVTILVMSRFIFLQTDLYAEEIYLKNGDRVSGKIVKEDEETIIIQTDAMGSISIKREFVKKIVIIGGKEFVEAQQEGPKLWKREVSIGYSGARGNTQNREISTSLYANRKTDHDEFTMKGDCLYSSSNRKMDTQKWFGMVRYAFSFWSKKWYNFYKLESDHDRFANIDYRIIPSTGMGYWFSDEPAWKAMTEVAIGLEHTNFRIETKETDEPVLIPRVFLEKMLFGESRISQDVFIYPSLSDTGEYRLHSETEFTSSINDNLSLCFSLIDDYNSDPAKNTKKNDVRLISSLAYSF